MRKIMLCLILLTLCGCVSPQELAERAKQAQIAQCLDLGFKPGTKDFANCRIQIMAMQQQERNSRRAAFAAIQASQMSKQVNCNTLGGTTTCY